MSINLNRVEAIHDKINFLIWSRSNPTQVFHIDPPYSSSVDNHLPKMCLKWEEFKRIQTINLRENGIMWHKNTS